jgi:hypothetical protein
MNAPARAVEGARYNFSRRETAISKLPPEAMTKLASLRESALRAQAMKDGLVTQLDNIRDNLNEAKADLNRFDRDYGATFMATEEVGEPDEHGNRKRVRVERERPERAPIAARVDRLKSELQKVTDTLNELHAGFSVDTLLDEVGAMDGKLIAVPPVKIPDKGTLKDILANLREKQSATESDIEEITNAPCTAAEAKAKLRAEVDVLAAQGAPEISTLFRGGSVAWQQIQIVSDGRGHHPHTVVSTQRDAFSLQVWIHKDQILKRLEEDIDFEADGANALTSEDRAAKLAALNKSLILLQRQEEAVICRLEDEGAMLITRRNTSPVILLGVELVK